MQPPDLVTKEDLALLKKITYGVVSKKDLANKCLEFAWNIIEYFNDRPPTELLDNAMKYLMDVATGDDFLKEKIEPFLLRCTQYCQKVSTAPFCCPYLNASAAALFHILPSFVLPLSLGFCGAAN